MLTKDQIDNAKHGYTCDGEGLYLQVSKSGAKSWIYRYQLNGKRREMGLGSVKDVSAEEARALAKKARVSVFGGADPIVEREKIREECSTCMFFDDVEIINENVAVGSCRRYPPAPGVEIVGETPFGDHVSRPQFPIVRDTDWCGEFKLTDWRSEEHTSELQSPKEL